MKKNVFARFIEIFKPSFLKNLIKENKPSKSWLFWFLSNTLFAILISFFIFSDLKSFVNEAKKGINQELPDGEIIMENQSLRTQGVDEPLFFHESEEDVVFILETQTEQYSKEDLKEYSMGFLFTEDTMYFKNEGSNKIEQLPYMEAGISDFVLSRESVLDFIDNSKSAFVTVLGIIAVIVFWLWISVIRLAFAAWWALIFWIMGLIFNVRNFTFGKSYLAMLNLYFIPLLLEWLLKRFLNFKFPFETFTILLIVFIINLYHLKKHQDRKKKAKAEVILEAKKIEDEKENQDDKEDGKKSGNEEEVTVEEGKSEENDDEKKETK